MASSSANLTVEKIRQNIHELTVLENELVTMKNEARLYKLQPNSQVYFLADKTETKANVTKQLNELKGRLKKY